MCRRCGVNCPLAVDNALITRIGRVLLESLGFVPTNMTVSTRAQLGDVGNTSAIPKPAFIDTLDFLEEELKDETGIDIPIPRDVEGAEYFFAAPVSDFIMEADTLLGIAKTFHAAGASWTVSTENYDAINYGLFYSDEVLEKVLNRLLEPVHRLKCKTLVIGECGHAHKSLLVVADRLLTGDLRVPRESALTVLRDIVVSGRLRLDPGRNDFPVTLHDPCNMVRLMGVVEPQREILRRVCPQFREMHPHGVDNYCCGGGSGFAIMSGHGFQDWRSDVAGRKKLQQILDAFSDCLSTSIPKYVCAPCSNCKGQIRDLLAHHGVWKQHRILYGGLAELIVNAMADVRPGFIEWEWR
jgi:Fe-S oxidoreductase